MVVILVIATFLVAFLIEGLLVGKFATKKATQAAAAQALSTVPALETPQDLLFHEGHSWVQLERAVVRAGMYHFTERLLGSVDAIEVPSIGARVTKGSPAWKVRFGTRTLDQQAPVSGVVCEVNRQVLDDPSLLKQSPYQNSWIVKILPDNINRELPALLTPARFMKWFDLQKAHLFAQQNPNLGSLYADGGVIAEGAAQEVDEETWRMISEKFFGTPPDTEKSSH